MLDTVFTTRSCSSIACIQTETGSVLLEITSVKALADGSLKNYPISRIESFPQAKTIFLQGNGIQSIGKVNTDVYGHPLETLDNSFILPANLQILNLSENTIDSIYNVSFPTSLRELDLSHSVINEFAITQESFDVVKKLSTFGTNCTIQPPLNCNGIQQAVQNGTFTICILSASTIAAAIALVIIGLLIKRCRNKNRSSLEESYHKQPTTTTSRESILTQNDVRFDPAIASMRLPRSDIHLLRELSSNDTFATHAGHWNSTGIPVIVRQLQAGASKEAMTEFMSEIRICTTLDNPHIISCLGVSWSTSYDVAMIFEWLELGALSHYVRERAGDPTFAWTSVSTLITRLSIATDIAKALCYLHDERKMTYSVLNMDNILVGKGTAKLANRVSKVNSQECLVTVAPEVFTGKQVGPTADIYALGIVMCELDHGVRFEPDETSNDDTIEDTIQEFSLIFSRKPTPRCPKEIAELIGKCVTLDPNARPSAQQVLGELEAFYDYCQRNTASLLLSTR
ncbi:kinase [Thraustotheca clavata]|uniref:Kinase n=1 Tax=Thraustotheca clavata TaxID=74557 RepID=A0A1V9YYH3_9STRA|nr:kinase [Thraustotheca clavata]